MRWCKLFKNSTVPWVEKEALLGGKAELETWTQRLPKGIQHLKDCDDDPKEADGTSKYLHDENLYKETGVLSISQGGPTAHDAHADSTEEVRQTHCETSSKHGVAWGTEKGSLRPSQKWVKMKPRAQHGLLGPIPTLTLTSRPK